MAITNNRLQELAFRHLTHELSEIDKIELQQLLQDPTNQRLFEELTDRQRVEAAVRSIQQFDGHMQTSWQKINNSKITLFKRKSLLKFLLITTMIVVTYFLTILSLDYTQGPKFNFSKNNCTVIEILDSVQSQMKIYHVNSYRLLENAKNISVSFKNASIEKVMERCERNQYFTLALDEDVIVVQPRFLNYNAVIIDDSGLPVSNASIIIEGELKSRSNYNGKFNLTKVFSNARIRITADNIEDKEMFLEGKISSVIKVNRKTQSHHEKSIIDSTFYH